MLYQSTRSEHRASDTAAVLEGIAPDGGLYIDPTLAARPFDWQGCLALSPLGMAEKILSHLLPGFAGMGELVRRAYEGKFDSEELTPLVKVGDDFVLELFHGPTAAFKDVALSMLPQLVTAARTQEGVRDKIVILTATSGDTGKAALEGFHDVEGTGILVFYPDAGVSPVQKAQMVTQTGANVKVCAVRGNFDDCQSGVKRAFAQLTGDALPAGCRLSSANSINIGRLAPQVVYYFIAYAALLRRGEIALGDKVDYVVPTGNFGDILAGYFAKLMGLPVGTLVCASNANRVLTDFLETGVYDKRRDFLKTVSPSMDILVSSNLERLLFLASGGDAALVADCMRKLSSEGVYRFPDEAMARIRADFAAACCEEEDCLATIGRVWREQGYLCDTHTAVAMKAARDFKASRPRRRKTVVLSTASPYKFPAAVLKAIGGELSGDEFAQMERLHEIAKTPIPRGLRGLKERPVLHTDVIDAKDLVNYVQRQLNEKGETR